MRARVNFNFALDEQVHVVLDLRPRGTAPKRLQPHNWHGQGAARGRGGDGGIATTCAAEESLVHEIQDLGRAQCQRRERQRRRVSTADRSKAKRKWYAELLGNAIDSVVQPAGFVRCEQVGLPPASSPANAE